MHNLVQTFSSAETRLETLNSQSFVDFDENYAIFLPVLDITTFKRSLKSTLRAERSAHVFHCRNKTRNSKFTIIRRF